MLSSRYNSFIGALIETANKSEILHSHSAVLMIGGKPMMWAFNKVTGDKNQHAEFSVISKYINQSGVFSQGLHKQWILPYNEKVLFGR